MAIRLIPAKQYRVGLTNPIAIDLMQAAFTSRCKAARLSFRIYRHAYRSAGVMHLPVIPLVTRPGQKASS